MDQQSAPHETYFKCPVCKSKILTKNAKKHLMGQHGDTKTIHKYLHCEFCQMLVLKDKYSGHLRKVHQTQPTKNTFKKAKEKKKKKWKPRHLTKAQIKAANQAKALEEKNSQTDSQAETNTES